MMDIIIIFLVIAGIILALLLALEVLDRFYLRARREKRAERRNKEVAEEMRVRREKFYEAWESRSYKDRPLFDDSWVEGAEREHPTEHDESDDIEMVKAIKEKE